MTLQKKKEHLIAREWELFQKVNNEGGRAACQDDHTTFVIMRSSQFALWPEELINSYSEDLDEAGAQGRNLLAEKYAWMMEKTHPEQFVLLREQLPRLSPEMLADIRAIVDKQLAWMRVYQQKYPLLARGNRALTSEEDTALHYRKFTVCGIGYSPCYIAFERGSTTLGNGSVSGFAYLLPEAFHSEVYHTAYLRVKGAEEEVAYTDAYDAKIEEVQERVEAIQDVRCELRYAEVKGEAQQKIDDAEKEVEDGKQEVADAEQELADGKAEAESELAEAESELTNGESELADGRQKLADSRRELTDGEQEIADGEQQITENEAKLADARSQIAAAVAKLKRNRNSQRQSPS